jgi:hypothetical protein
MSFRTQFTCRNVPPHNMMHFAVDIPCPSLFHVCLRPPLLRWAVPIKCDIRRCAGQWVAQTAKRCSNVAQRLPGIGQGMSQIRRANITKGCIGHAGNKRSPPRRRDAPPNVGSGRMRRAAAVSIELQILMAWSFSPFQLPVVGRGPAARTRRPLPSLHRL